MAVMVEDDGSHQISWLDPYYAFFLESLIKLSLNNGLARVYLCRVHSLHQPSTSRKGLQDLMVGLMSAERMGPIRESGLNLIEGRRSQAFSADEGQNSCPCRGN